MLKKLNNNSQGNNHQTAMYFWKKFSFILITIFIMAIVIEIGLRVIFYQQMAKHPIAIIEALHKLNECTNIYSKVELIYQRSLYRYDPILGYAIVPGEHDITLKWNSLFREKTWNFKAIIGQDGYRTTSDSPQQYQAKPQIWIFGDSYTWGWPLDNKDTFPWLLQLKLNNYYVRNLGVNGYGNVHALLQLEDMIKKGEKPKIAIFVYNSYDLPRNVAAPSRLREFRLHLKEFERHVNHPMAFINGKGLLEIKMIPLKPVDMPDPDPIYMQRVTMKIFRKIKDICDENNIIPVLTSQTDKYNDPIICYCDTIGFILSDIYLKKSDKYLLLPFDSSHPNALAHKIYADKLLESLKKVSII